MTKVQTRRSLFVFRNRSSIAPDNRTSQAFTGEKVKSTITKRVTTITKGVTTITKEVTTNYTLKKKRQNLLSLLFLKQKIEIENINNTKLVYFKNIATNIC